MIVIVVVMMMVGLRARINPVVLFFRKNAHRQKTQYYSEQVHAQNVEQQVVPPAFLEVGQDVLQRALKDLETYTYDRAQYPVAKDQSMSKMTKEVREHEWVQNRVPKHVPVAVGMARVVQAAVDTIVFVGQRNAEFGVQDVEKVTNIIDVKHKKEGEEHEEQDTGRVNATPHHGVRSHHQAVAELNGSVTEESERRQQSTGAQPGLQRRGRVTQRIVYDDSQDGAQTKHRARLIDQAEWPLFFDKASSRSRA